MSALAPYNVSLLSASPFFVYNPNRDGDATLTWNSSYTQSSVWPPIANQQEPQGVPYRRTLSNSASMSFEYLGSDVYLCLSSGGASYTLTVDGTPVTTTRSGSDSACTGYGADTLLYSSGVRQGNHDVQLKVSASASEEFRFWGGIVTMGVTSGSSHVLEKLVDDQSPGWNMVPSRGTAGDQYTWQSVGDVASNNVMNNTHSFTCIYDSVKTQSASYSFTGAGGVLLRGTIGMGLQVFSIDLNEEHIPLDATSVWPDPSGVVLFARGGLDPGTKYTITLRNFNENYPRCDSLYYLPPSQHVLACCANLDGLVLLGDGQGTPPSLPPSQTSVSVPLSLPPSTSESSSTLRSSDSSTPTSSAIPLTSVTTSIPPVDPATSSNAPGSRKSSVGLIVGVCIGVAGGVVAIVFAVFAIFIRVHNRRRPPAPPPQSSGFPAMLDEPIPYEPDIAPARQDKIRALADAAMIPKPLPTSTDVSRGPTPFWAESMDPSEIVTASETGTDAFSRRHRRMAPEDLEEVLAFVSQRMDRDREGGGNHAVQLHGDAGAILPPGYRR